MVAAEQQAMTQPPLTDSQITRFFNSYPAAHKMARNYWGERKYTPAHKMLDPEGTFDRAYAEMRAAGKLPDFDALLQSYGFEDRLAWKRLAVRISYAYVMLRSVQNDPVRAEQWRQWQSSRQKALDDERAKAQGLPPGQREVAIRDIDLLQHKIDEEMRGARDSESLRPYTTYFEVMDKYLLQRQQ